MQIGKLIKCGFRLSSVKYPLEFHRPTKSIKDYNTLNCSELENIEFYIGAFFVRNILPKEYFDHYLTYVIGLRLLTKEKISYLGKDATFLS